MGNLIGVLDAGVGVSILFEFGRQLLVPEIAVVEIYFKGLAVGVLLGSLELHLESQLVLLQFGYLFDVGVAVGVQFEVFDLDFHDLDSLVELADANFLAVQVHLQLVLFCLAALDIFLIHLDLDVALLIGQLNISVSAVLEIDLELIYFLLVLPAVFMSLSFLQHNYFLLQLLYDFHVLRRIALNND